MRRLSLILLVAIPLAAVAAVSGVAFWRYPGSTLTIGTFAGVFVVAYGALAAPWITGYLDDKKAHTEVLNRLFFRQFELWSAGRPGLDGNFNVWYPSDKFPWHAPMELTARYRIGKDEPFRPIYTQPMLLPIAPSAREHLRSYPELNSALIETAKIVNRYNRLRRTVLDLLQGLAEVEMRDSYPGLHDQDQHRQAPGVVLPWFDSRIVGAAVYLRVQRELRLRPGPFPEMKMPDGGKAGWTGFTNNALAIKSNDPADLSLEKLDAVIGLLSAAREVRGGIERLSRLEQDVWDPVNRLLLFEPIS